MPFEHDVLAVATKLMLVPTVLPFDGLETVTPAKAEVAARNRTKMAVEVWTVFCIYVFLRSGIVGWDPVKLYSSEGYTGQAGKPSVVPGRSIAQKDLIGRKRRFMSGDSNLYRLHPSVKRKKPCSA